MSIAPPFGLSFGSRRDPGASGHEFAYLTEAFTETQWQALEALRVRYEHSQDVLGTRELDRLAFVRWLYQTGRIEP